MSHHRTLKPSFFTHEVLGELPPLARLMFQGLWCHADREGRLEDRPRFLRTVILPYDECDPESLLAQLHEAKLVVRYEVDGRRLISIPGFARHQRPHPKERKSEFAPPPPPVPLRNDWPWESQGTTQPRKGQPRVDPGRTRQRKAKAAPVRVVRPPAPAVYPPLSHDELELTASSPETAPRKGRAKKAEPPPVECAQCHGPTHGALFDGDPVCDRCFDSRLEAARA